MNSRIGHYFIIAATLAVSTYASTASAESTNLLDWLTKGRNQTVDARPEGYNSVSIGKSARNTIDTKKIYLGRAPYICGPSGFGNRSKCFLRASL